MTRMGEVNHEIGQDIISRRLNNRVPKQILIEKKKTHLDITYQDT